MLQLKGLVECADPDPIRLKTVSGKCNILEVTFNVHREALGTLEETGRVAEETGHFGCEKKRPSRRRKAECERLNQHDQFTQAYLASRLTENSAAFVPITTTPRHTSSGGADVGAVRELLAFHEEASSASDAKLLVLKRDIVTCEQEVWALLGRLSWTRRGLGTAAAARRAHTHLARCQQPLHRARPIRGAFGASPHITTSAVLGGLLPATSEWSRAT
mmetsp:Transcript_23090/g.45871  ORF Transcript_23090/g.45871 Transcript_23090/m.45871 type:complete len:218 (+) Transcript_23090:203-856(+)